MRLIIHVLRDLLAPSGALFPNKMYIITSNWQKAVILMPGCVVQMGNDHNAGKKSRNPAKKVFQIINSKLTFRELNFFLLWQSTTKSQVMWPKGVQLQTAKSWGAIFICLHRKKVLRIQNSTFTHSDWGTQHGMVWEIGDDQTYSFWNVKISAAENNL